MAGPNYRNPQDVVYEDTGEPVNPYQAGTYRHLQREGGIDRSQPKGSPRNPMVLRGKDDLLDAPPNSYYIDDRGGVRTTPIPDEELGDRELIDLRAPDGTPAKTEWRAVAGWNLNPSESSRVDVIRNNYPKAEFGRDKKGALVVRLAADQPWSYMNRPGFSEQDGADILGQVAQYMPAGRAGLGATTIGGAMMRSGLASSATSVTQDIAAEAMGSEQGIDGFKAMTAGAGGAFGEIAAPVLGHMTRSAGQAMTRATPQPVREAMTDAAARLPVVGKRFAQRARDAVPPPATQTDFRIPISRGQQTGDFDQIAFEQAAARGARGEEASQIMRGHLDDQARAVGEAGTSFVPRGPATVYEAAGTVREGVRDAAKAKKSAVNSAYEAVEQSPARVQAPTVTDLPSRIRSGLEAELITPEVMGSLNPGTRALLGEIETLAGQASKSARGAQPAVAESLESGVPVGMSSGVAPTFPLSQIERVRKAVNNRLATAQGEDRLALGVMKREFDSWLDDAVDKQLLGGDPEALDLLKNARKLHGEYRRTYGGGRRQEAADRMMQKLISENATETDAANLLFGRSRLTGSGDAVQVVKRIGDATSRSGEHWEGLRQGAVLRLMGRFERNSGAGATNVNYKALADDWTDALDGSGAPLMKELFSPAEIGQMRRFRDVLRQITPPEGSVNRSGSGYEMGRAVSQAFGALTSKLKVLAPVTKAMDDASNAGRARQAIEGTALVRRPSTPLIPAAAAGYGALMAESPAPLN